MSRSTNTHADTFEAAELFAPGLVAERDANTADDQPAVIIAIDASQLSNLPIVGIADMGGANGSIMRVVTEGRCWAKAGDAIAVTDRDLTCNASGLLIPWTPGNQRVAVFRGRSAVPVGPFTPANAPSILVDVAIDERE